MNFSIGSNIIDIENQTIFPGIIWIEDGTIVDIEKSTKSFDTFIIPGFVDSHIHIESSMLTPSEFAKEVVKFGTVATVSDPHEIANVLGVEGVEFMIENSRDLPFKFFWGVPSCVPATLFESSGAVIDSEAVKMLFEKYNLLYLSEMMNFPGVIYDDPEVMKKIAYANQLNKPIDGHIPGISGEQLVKYIKSGISTDHECITIDEAVEKISLGMKILIREGSAAKNFDALIPLLNKYPDMIMFCSDDKHPDELMSGHINLLVKKAINNSYKILDVLSAVSLNPVKHYGLDVGLLRIGDKADFNVIDNFEDFNILRTYINGDLVAENGISLIETNPVKPKNNFKADFINKQDIQIKAESDKINVIKAYDCQLLTDKLVMNVKKYNALAVPDVDNDILKLVVLNRYQESKPALAFVNNFGLKRGALATSVAHDSHNIIAVGADDASIVKAINEVIRNKGGMCAADAESLEVLPLPIAGLMSDLNAVSVASKYSKLNKIAQSFGTQFSAPFMTLSFLALLVIPHLKLSDKGLFDVSKFQFTKLFV